MKKTKRGIELTITKLLLFMIAIVFILVAIKILYDIRTEGISIIDSIRDLFIFGP
jgi:cell division protein FtsL